ncbi:hypothetical protein [Pseudonocardia sp. KRD291]|uniref:hypothetical protein n=1 Tax=Pseudonocardia sp. KRD291 TaxID=2792007 RepID=UPI001C4A420A|nr:hypothetical protein [Pseudonocardia sp. KRD291]MBW0101948.1 hypothetical protein [Pseudonocardia sp. KRD291]
MTVAGLPEHDPKFDGLLTQVDPDNVLAVHAALRRQADDMYVGLINAQTSLQIGRCGGDPISADAQVAFNSKLTDVLDLHWRHQMEVDEAAALLRLTALHYGHTDDDIAHALAAQDRRG